MGILIKMNPELLFKDSQYLPQSKPQVSQLQSTNNLLAIFEDCHNYIYANEGLLKDKIFHEIVKLLLMKLMDETLHQELEADFCITESEYEEVLMGCDKNTFLARLNSLLLEVKKSGSKIFVSESRINLQPLTIAYIVSKLQTVSLTHTPSDIKGQAFQTFFSKYQRGDRGEFFTPHPVVRLMAGILDPKVDEKVLDPACGSGGFLIHTVRYISENPNNKGENFDKYEYISKRIRGVEFNPDIAMAATVRLAFEGGSGEEIHFANALDNLSNEWKDFDIILTNPPFGSKGKVEDPKILKNYELAHKWSSGLGNWEIKRDLLQPQTPEILFVERCVSLLKPSGRMGVVVPEGMLQNITTGYVREWLRTRCQILAVISLPQETFIPYGTGIKTSVLILQKKPCEQNKPCFMARIEKIGYDVKGQPIYKKNSKGEAQIDVSGNPVIDDDIESTVRLYKSCQNKKPFDSDVAFVLSHNEMNSRLDVNYYLPGDRFLLEQLESHGAKPLRDIAEIVTESSDFRLDGDSIIQYVAISDIDHRSVRIVAGQTIKAHEAPSRATYRIRTGDIITAISGASTGTDKHATAYVTTEHDGAICSNGFAVIRHVREVDPLFLLCYMRTDYFLRQIRRLLTGHAIPVVSLEDFAGILVPIPPKVDQLKLANAFKEIQLLQDETYKTANSLVGKVKKILEETLS